MTIFDATEIKETLIELVEWKKTFISNLPDDVELKGV